MRLTRTLMKSRLARRRSSACGVKAPAKPDGQERDYELLESMPAAVVVSDSEGRIVFANRQMERMTGYARQELARYRIEVLVPEPLRTAHRKHRRDFYLTRAGPRSMGAAQRDFPVLRKDGSEFYADIALGPLRGPGGQQTVAVIRDVTARRSLEAALEHQALHDPLTDLGNRTLFFDRLNQAILSSDRDRNRVALVMLDLERFKVVNDAFGHVVGDKVLKQLASRLATGLRATDTVARLGGDEFAWILPRISGREAAERMVRKLMRALKRSFSTGGHRIEVAISAGIALYPDDGENSAMLMRHADAAMYAAKRAGGGLGLIRRGMTSAQVSPNLAC